MKPLKLAGKWPQGLLLILPVILSLFAAPVARSEGSRELTTGTGTGSRPFLEYRNDADTTSGIPRRTRIKVYARVGETINLGSSAMWVGNTGIANNGNILYRAPNGASGNCKALAPLIDPNDPNTPNLNFGKIQTRAQEADIDGPFSATNPDGYTPCTVTVGPGQEGVWDIEFTSPNPALTGNPITTLLATGNWPPQGNNDNFVTAWDVTVRNAGGTNINGRAFANYLAINSGFTTNSFTEIRPLNSQAFILTEDGYIYRVNLNEMRPAGFIFFANKNGFLDANRNPIFQSVGKDGRPIIFDSPADAQKDNVTHKIFFNNPTLGDLPGDTVLAPGGSTWLRNQPAPPPSPSNFRFIGQEGTAGQAGTNPLGGDFKFDSTGAGTYRLTIDVSGNGVYGDGNDVILQGRVVLGSNTVQWDGRDRNGVPVQVSEVGYGAQIQFFGGEVHFPFFDVEQNSKGLIVQRLNEPPGFPLNDPNYNRFRVYYNSSGFPQSPNQPNPLSALLGVDSSNGAHNFEGSGTTGWGDDRGIDTWVLFPSLPFELEQRIVIAQADLKITKSVSPTPAVAGGPITYTITVRNAGPSNIRAINPATLSDIFSANGETVTNLTWTCEIIPPANPPAGATGTCIDATGTGNVSNARLALDVGFSARYTLTGVVIPTATQNIVNQATVTRPNDVADPVNDDNDANNNNNRTETATVTVPLTPGNPLVGVAKAAGTPIDNGDRSFTIPYTLVVRNYGNLPLTTLQVTENLNDTFANIPYSLEPTSLTSPTLTVNSNFNGNTDTNLLATGNTLAVNTEATISFRVRITPGNNLGPFNNQVTASGTSPGGTPVSDLSTNGANPGGNNNGDPRESNEVTPVTLRGNPKLELQKRITRINGTVVGQGENLTNWPTNFVRGLTNPNTIQPGDEVEYTIYFLSAGSGPMDKAVVCDPLQNYQTFRTDTFNGQTPTEGTFGAEVGIALALNPPNPDLPTAYLRSANSASNRGRFYPSGTATPLICQPNVRGAVVVDIGSLGVGDYGFIRFRVRID
ncbi:DUF11 domain-containing protein [Laspinema sp. D1]|uniref:DUF11 domain-containing protein n=1 Tax=Laspinema palackyanum TaxID=3231601 RepID=UPI0034811614|nr:DUF11 domain-containing protein [Laspinema sp. D2b]